MWCTSRCRAHARFSPDGRWLAYASNESGRSEVYDTAFPGGGKSQISADGGGFPRWRGDGAELYYLSPDNAVMAVRVKGVSGASITTA
jgi:Tol biopolymer transport system component